MSYYIIYDGNCNLCVTLVQQLENLDRGQLFQYIPMQDAETLNQFSITPEDCEQGMILIDANTRDRRWQGSDAAEEIARLFPVADGLIEVYRMIPGLKWAGDRVYEQIRDNRYTIFGKRSSTYYAAFLAKNCSSGSCST